jgi:hypothetical protein
MFLSIVSKNKQFNPMTFFLHVKLQTINKQLVFFVMDGVG